MTNYAVRTIWQRVWSWSQAAEQRRELRCTAVTMAAVLASYGTALVVEHYARLHTDIVILAVVLAVTLGRTQRGRSVRPQLVALILLPAIAAAAARVGTLMVRHPDAGDALFAAAVSVAIWIRRFGPAYTRAGTIATLPFIALLVAPVPSTPGHSQQLWSALIAFLAGCWVLVAQLVDERVLRPVRVPADPPAAVISGRTPSRRLPASTRMSLQMAAALSTAFVLGRFLYPEHWSWMVLTAYIVGSGNRGRRDVANKSILRVLGAAAGTIAATGFAGLYSAGDKRPVVIIFLVLAVATWLRTVNYAFWAAGMTAALALLYGYFGQSSPTLLRDRLAGIVIGAAIGVAAAWFILPVKTRRRTLQPASA